MALWCRRFRSGPSSAVTTRRPVTSEAVEEHSREVSRGCGRGCHSQAQLLTARLSCWGKHSEAPWRQTGKTIRWSSGAEEEWQARTFRLDAPISSCLSLMRVSSGHLARSMAKMNSALKLTCWP